MTRYERDEFLRVMKVIFETCGGGAMDEDELLDRLQSVKRYARDESTRLREMELTNA
jgi:hypothetical protein